jgi:hypothetical protein
VKSQLAGSSFRKNNNFKILCLSEGATMPANHQVLRTPLEANADGELGQLDEAAKMKISFAS